MDVRNPVTRVRPLVRIPVVDRINPSCANLAKGESDMAAVNPKKIKQLLDQTDLLRQVLEKAGEKGSDRLRRIKEQDIRREIEDAMGGQFDAANWSILEKDKQAELYKKLAMLRLTICRRGP